MRSGSTRSPKKNTRPFLETGESLFQLKMQSILKLCESDEVFEVIISSDDKDIFNQVEPYLSDKIKLDIRPKELCLSSTKVQDLISYVPKITKGDHVLWLHVTSPFVEFETYYKAMESYKYSVVQSRKYDSLMSVNKLQQFIWSDNKKKIINVDRNINPWPNTQDLDPLYEINHAFYISSRDNYISLNDRIGKNPCLYICEGLEKIDIDWEEDFMIAELIAKGYTPQLSRLLVICDAAAGIKLAGAWDKRDQDECWTESGRNVLCAA